VKTIIEPFRIKSVEPIYFTTKEERVSILKKAYFNPFLIHADNVLIDLLTDSGTSAMSSAQWAGIMIGDESYAGSKSFFHFEKTIQDLTGMPIVIPTHQGRAAEKILFSVIGGKGKFVVSNTLFDTTRANIEFTGAEGVDLLCKEGKIPSVPAPFKGNLDTVALEQFVNEKGAENIAACIITVTNNSGGGQPVSMQNIKEVSAICKKNGILLFIDACRFAENSYFIKLREEGYADVSIPAIANELFSYADGCTMSAKKDAFANIGGFIALRNEELAVQCRNLLIITEGFTTYGGLAGRDLEAIAIGLKEVMEEYSAAGIAANQLGQNIRACLVQDKFLVNPTIIEQRGSVTHALEGCLSIEYGQKRYIRPASEEVAISYQDIEGNEHRRVFEDFEARVALHEIRHLNGKLINEGHEND